MVENQRQRKDKHPNVLVDAHERMKITLLNFYSPTNWESISIMMPNFVQMGELPMNTRIEHDTMGEIAVPADRHWGAQTQRSVENFRIGGQRQPK